MNPSQTKIQRPRFLTILCILSGLAAVYGAVTGLSGALSPPDVDSGFVDDLLARLETLELPMEGLKEDMEAYYVNLMINFGNVGTANFLFYGIQFIGVILMFRLNRIGFVLYGGAQFGLAFSALLFGGFNDFGWMVFALAIAWSVVWIIAYATQLKYFPTWNEQE